MIEAGSLPNPFEWEPVLVAAGSGDAPPSRAAVSGAVRDLLAVYLADHPSAHAINNGACDAFVADLHERLPSGEIWESPYFDDDRCLDAHMFFRCGGLWYDAEAPDGVAEFWQLPLFVNNERLRREAMRGRSQQVSRQGR